MDIIKTKLKRAFRLSLDLVDHMEENHLKLHLDQLPSNALGDQYWCIIGARESYIRAVENDGWAGFSCSLKDVNSKDEIIRCLASTDKDLDQLFLTDLSETGLNLLLDLLEHEVQHHGQLIRYIYGNRLSFPQSWTDRYTVK